MVYNGRIYHIEKGVGRMSYLAHITVINGKRVEQTNKQHLIETANIAKKRLQVVGLGATGYLAGILHDMGKQKKVFNEYLEQSFRGDNVTRGSVNHTFAGAIYIIEKYHHREFYDKLTSEILAYAIASHHGIIDCLNADGIYGLQHRIDNKDMIQYEETLQNYFVDILDEKGIDDLFESAVKEIRTITEKICTICPGRNALDNAFGLISRLVLSAIVEGDRTSTAEFMNGSSIRKINATKALWERELVYLEDELCKMKSDTPINQARAYISEQCKKAAYAPNGIYRLSIPTGSGKTLASLRYSLAHAAEYEKRRIIFVIPLLSILEQNSDVIKQKISDRNIVLEHHSNVVHEKETKEYLDEYDLLTTNWDSPVIITTLVQLLNTLFSSKTSSIRRMQALVDSVIVIDEIQSLPEKTVNMFNMAMNFMVTCCKCTVVLSSATQPCFENTTNKLLFAHNPDIVPYQEKVFAPFKRTILHNKVTTYGMSVEELAVFTREIVSKKSSTLVVCNTKATALKLYKCLQTMPESDISNYTLVHLSASMCPQHRWDALNRIKISLLDKDRKTICISTQIIEAGVDISFESVVRVLAGMDNVTQTVGRCNRSDEYGYLCDAYIVKLKTNEENLKYLKEIEYAQSSTLKLLNSYQSRPEYYDNDLLGGRSILNYYTNYFSMPEVKKLQGYPVKINGREYRLCDLISSNNSMSEGVPARFCLRQSFKSAGERFQVFDDSTIDVIVPYNEEAKDIIVSLCSQKAHYDKEYLSTLVERAKKYTIHIFSYQRAILDDMDMLYGDKEGHFLTMRTGQCYDPLVGLIIENNYFL